MVGKYMDLLDAYKSLNEALKHAGMQTLTEVKVDYIDAEDIERDGTAVLNGVDAILVPGGFGDRGVEGKITAVRYAREKANSLPRHLPGHARGPGGVCPQRLRGSRAQTPRR